MFKGADTDTAVMHRAQFLAATYKSSVGNLATVEDRAMSVCIFVYAPDHLWNNLDPAIRNVNADLLRNFNLH